jgi:hypothetical protein
MMPCLPASTRERAAWSRCDLLNRGLCRRGDTGRRSPQPVGR